MTETKRILAESVGEIAKTAAKAETMITLEAEGDLPDNLTPQQKSDVEGAVLSVRGAIEQFETVILEILKG